MKITVVIPARMASSRFPGKPLAPILDLPMIEHIRRRSKLASGVSSVVVATCDKEIKDYVEEMGGQVIMTKNSHERCTDRVQEAAQSISSEIIVMVQGDEPLLNPEVITQVAEPLINNPDLQVVNLVSQLQSMSDLQNPDIVKAVCDVNKNIMFLTRSPVPYFRENVKVPVYRQTGIMAFRLSFLSIFASLSETALEEAESIDMLRLLENGVRIQAVLVDYVTVGVDRHSDIKAVELLLHDDPLQASLYARINQKND